jgi:hypothetical protein
MRGIIQGLLRSVIASEAKQSIFLSQAMTWAEPRP